MPEFNMRDLRPQGVTIEKASFGGKDAYRVTMPASKSQDPEKEALTDRDFMAIAPADFGDGVISVNLASVLSEEAPAYARGFIGLAFRIDGQNRFESIYLRPTNSRADDQVRRNRSIQYVAYPHFTFPRLRAEEPGKYETYADFGLEEWINFKLVVRGYRAELYLNDGQRPALIVTDLKLGSDQRGGIGLWIEAGTIAYFADLKISA